MERIPQPAGAEPSDPRFCTPLLPALCQDPPVPRSRMPPCRASLQARCTSPVAAEKQRCWRKGCCRNRGKLTGISKRVSGSSCVWSPESRQRSSFIHSFIHSFPSFTMKCLCELSCSSHVRLFATPWAVVHQIPLSMKFLQEY